MSRTVCLAASTLGYIQGGGHLWVYLNWAIGLRANGCRVIWLERIGADKTAEQLEFEVAALRESLRPYGFDNSIALLGHDAMDLEHCHANDTLSLRQAAAEADLLLNLDYSLPEAAVKAFSRSALLDIDPGLLQLWISRNQLQTASHDLYFTIGETVDAPGTRVPATHQRWIYTPPCVALSHWPIVHAGDSAPFTTITHWSGDEWVEDGLDVYANDKKTGFLPFLDLPRITHQPLELAACLGQDPDDRRELTEAGWRVYEAPDVAATPGAYQHYIQQSRGEFSCAKPAYVKMQTAWISDRTLCYLASGKPAVVQDTGPSGFLPQREGLLRFQTLKQAAECLNDCEENYEKHCRAARALVEKWFDAATVARKLLQRAIG